jgi:hypothetical protein
MSDSFLEYRKTILQKNLIDFVFKFMKIKNIKDLLRSVKNEVPKLLDFKNANIYVYDVERESLKAMVIDENNERLLKMEDPKGFERDFYFDERSIVRFPRNMGTSGFCFENDALTFINGFQKSSKKFASPFATCVAIG